MYHDESNIASGPPPADPYYNAHQAVDTKSGGLMGASPSRPRSSAFHEAHKQAERAAQQHAQAAAAIEFFTKHPGFDTFVSLVRSGAIQF